MIAICCITSIAYAEQEIVGAFGVRLGDTVDESMPFLREDKQGHQQYLFTEDTSNEIFTLYWVQATHKTKLIFAIYAEQLYDEPTDCGDRYVILKTALDKKYAEDKYASVDWNYSKGDRRVHFTCYHQRNGSALLRIDYIDALLKK